MASTQKKVFNDYAVTMDSLDHVRLLAAVDYAAEAHRNQRRKGGEKIPYINHPIGVAMILIWSGIVDINILIAAILHDVVEDCGVLIDSIRIRFGEEVARMVAEVTDNKADPKDKRKRDQVEHAKTISHGAKLIKLADKLYNTRDLLKGNPFEWTDKRVAGTLLWSFEVLKNLTGTNEQLEGELWNAIDDAADRVGYSWLLDADYADRRAELLAWYYEEMQREQAADDARKAKKAMEEAKKAAFDQGRPTRAKMMQKAVEDAERHNKRKFKDTKEKTVDGLISVVEKQLARLRADVLKFQASKDNLSEAERERLGKVNADVAEMESKLEELRFPSEEEIRRQLDETRAKREKLQQQLTKSVKMDGSSVDSGDDADPEYLLVDSDDEHGNLDIRIVDKDGTVYKGEMNFPGLITIVRPPVADSSTSD